jgi:hypothetical protein
MMSVLEIGRLKPAVGPTLKPSPKVAMSTRSGSIRAFAAVPSSSDRPVGRFVLTAANGWIPFRPR